ncbi:MAG: oligoendopeptidase F [Sedimentisphaerales bacterium]|nr:oligoendopeptidase F [Sedimentisphaerales bacterium]
MNTGVLLMIIACRLTFVLAGATGQPEGTVEQRYRWNLEHVYPSDQAWEEARAQVAREFDKILQYKGTLTTSPARLLEALELNTRIQKELARLSSYASMRYHQDMRQARYQGMEQQMSQMDTEYGSKASFIVPELAAMEAADVERFLSEEPDLAQYRMFLLDIQRTKAHRLSEKEERILAEASIIAAGPYEIYQVFSDADLPYPRIKLSDGSEVLLNKAGYAKYRALPDREDRKKVFEAFWGAIESFKASLAAQLNAQVKKDLFYARVRNYPSCLHAALDRDNIPVEVYQNLISNVHRRLDTFHRYLKLRRRLLGVERLEYYDIYAPVAKDLRLEYSYDQACSLVLEALRPLGDRYVGVVKQAIGDRWIDVYPAVGKRSGAYSEGACYDVHPYILLNYNGHYEDVSTLAHELGHTVHSYLSNKTQPYPLADYSTFVAEVASTLNEALLMDMMLKKIEDRQTRLSLLTNYLDSFKGTLFRQTQFAEFELAIHQQAERGLPLTAETLGQIYGQIIRKYYGHDEGVCHIDDLYTVEWAYVRHFYYNFYVFQYATSFTASMALSRMIISGDRDAVDRYIALLKSGGSDYPINQLRAAGIDMLTDEPFEQAIGIMEGIMNQIEAMLIDQRS